MMRKSNYKQFYTIGLMMAMMSLICVAAFGQANKKFAQAQQENAAKLRQYSWKSRTEIRKDNETKSVQLNEVRYDLDGTLQQTPISVTKQEIPTSGLRGLIAKKKKEEFVEMLTDLGDLAKSYSHLSAEKMQRFMTNALFTPEKNPTQNLICIQGRDVLQPGDSMTIWIDALTRKQRKVEISTFYESDRVRIVSEFQDLPNGPTYSARSIIDYPGKELVITTENFDHKRKQ